MTLTITNNGKAKAMTKVIENNTNTTADNNNEVHNGQALSNTQNPVNRFQL